VGTPLKSCHIVEWHMLVILWLMVSQEVIPHVKLLIRVYGQM